ncbi:MAG: patatin-like phospholipase family protein [Desulfamplus sp.]|nr:patatin-like phospholipase family protein [Desulfamplus sp.]
MKKALILSGGGSRGSFQVGVWKYLKEINWYPDMICGTSVGAINAVAIGCGLTVKQLSDIWVKSGRRKIYSLKLLDFAANILLRKRLVPLMDTTPFKSMLQSSVDFGRLKKSNIEIIISAVNLHTALPEFFNQNEITIDHVMASGSMPVIFPSQMIDGVPYWDGGIMANIPLLPALARGMNEIIVVPLSPVGHVHRLPEPRSLMDAGEHLMEQSLVSSYQSTLMGYGSPGINDLVPGSSYLRKKNMYRNEALNMYRNPSLNPDDPPLNPAGQDHLQTHATPRIITIAPSKMLGIPSLLNFTPEQANSLMAQGYDNARSQLKEISRLYKKTL